MGYSVYHNGHRWAGYGVPGECDMPHCKEEIDLGVDAKCEEHVIYNGYKDESDQDWDERIDEGCGLFFCSAHEHPQADHSTAVEKPESAKWLAWILGSPSWETWRDENARDVVEYRRALARKDYYERQAASVFVAEELEAERRIEGDELA